MDYLGNSYGSTFLLKLCLSAGFSYTFFTAPFLTIVAATGMAVKNIFFMPDDFTWRTNLACGFVLDIKSCKVYHLSNVHSSFCDQIPSQKQPKGDILAQSEGHSSSLWGNWGSSNQKQLAAPGQEQRGWVHPCRSWTRIQTQIMILPTFRW